MKIIGSLEQERTPFIGDWIKDNKTKVEEAFLIKSVIVCEKGLLVTVLGDEFVSFIWKGTKLHGALLRALKKNHKSQTRNKAIAVVPLDETGGFSINEVPNWDCVIQYGETGTKKDKYEQDYLEPVKIDQE